MHFNVYLDDATGQQLNAVAHRAGESRNALIRKAVAEWLARQSQPQWPEAVLAYEGMPEVTAFEADRDQLRPPEADSLA